ncbi:MAG: TadE family protein [Myxococcota bacterium]|nr:TadE family protein [Myxococcota bacterium]
MSTRLTRRQRTGGAAIEFGLIFPVLVAILGSVIEYGLMFNEYLSVVSATRNGARWGANWTVDTGDSEAEAIERVRESLELVSLSCSEAQQDNGECSVTAVTDTLPTYGYTYVEVTTRLDYSPIFGGLLPYPDQLVYTATMVTADQ